MARIVCWACGTVEVVTGKEPSGSITLAKGRKATLERRLSARARHAYDGVTLLVPGIPEAEDDDAKIEAARAFSERLALA